MLCLPINRCILSFQRKLIKSILLWFITGLIFISGCRTEDTTKQVGEKTGKAQVSSRKINLSAGETIYNKYCFYCHGKEGRGDGAIGIGLTLKPVDFVGDIERMKKSDEALFESISKGIHRKAGGEQITMPQWDLILHEDDIWSVLAYIRQLSEKGRTKDAEGH
ncbi:MAG: hypothetical protein A2035_02635 [Nitrospirae bacterium GWA2_42_11]|nr:MAG: hypothetical protein A2035_02635 [Nitrospirae bacterium GWA2_42_11]HAS17960.1 hypothetical protein [Nitrospiraceae bacterium]